MIPKMNRKKLGYLLFCLILIACHGWPVAAVADDHKKRESHAKSSESRKAHHDDDRQARQQYQEDEGNETTGQTAAWLLVAANLSVALSILIKGVIRYYPLAPETKNSIKTFNRLQKKHLMRFHFLLNPIACGMAGVHFLLSTCRQSSLPEWGLLLMTMMVLLGLMIKFKRIPKSILKKAYRLHTAPASFSVIILLLVVGHLIVD